MHSCAAKDILVQPPTGAFFTYLLFSRFTFAFAKLLLVDKAVLLLEPVLPSIL